MSAEAWIALVGLSFPAIGAVIWACVQFALVRRDVRSIKDHQLPNILQVLNRLPCRLPRQDAGDTAGKTAACDLEEE